MPRRWVIVLVLGLAASLLALPTRPVAAAGERLTTVATDLQVPLLVTAPPDDDRLFIVERAGRILVLHPGGRREVFADLRSRISTEGEGGLLGLAFSPRHASDGRLWVHYYGTDGASHVDRLEVGADPDRVDPTTRTRVLRVPQPATNHNGGMLAFARDGMLLVALGDGGGAGDPFGNGQDTSTLLGSLLRLDVLDRGGGGYAVPADNPFVGRSGRDEIWAYGLRNPYRFSVDRRTGDVWIGDVGQSRREELNRLPYRPGTAYNLGWNRWEGSLCYSSCGSRSGLVFPVAELDHDADGVCSITGGYVSRSSRTPDLAGDHVFGDFCAGRVLAYDPGTDRVRTLDLPRLSRIFSFGEDARGDLYVMDASTVWRIDGSGTRFTDVAAGSTFARDIERIAAAGITRGCNPPANTRFCPDEPVTRAQMAAFLTRALGLPGRAEQFVDVAADNIFARDIGAIAAQGITRGCNPPRNDRFCPSDPVTRAQMAAFLTRAEGLRRQPEPWLVPARPAPGRSRHRVGTPRAAGLPSGACATPPWTSAPNRDRSRTHRVATSSATATAGRSTSARPSRCAVGWPTTSPAGGPSPAAHGRCSRPPAASTGSSSRPRSRRCTWSTR